MPQKRFLKKVHKTRTCWIWTSAFDGRGYGLFWLNGSSKRAHRVSYTMFIGPIPDGLDVLHSCDNPSCVNPDHLRVGTHQENMTDMVRRSRQKSPHQEPETSRSNKLNRDQVAEIRRMLNAGFKQKEIAEKFNTTSASVSLIKNRKQWKV